MILLCGPLQDTEKAVKWPTTRRLYKGEIRHQPKACTTYSLVKDLVAQVVTRYPIRNFTVQLSTARYKHRQATGRSEEIADTKRSSEHSASHQNSEDSVKDFFIGFLSVCIDRTHPFHQLHLTKHSLSELNHRSLELRDEWKKSFRPVPAIVARTVLALSGTSGKCIITFYRQDSK